MQESLRPNRSETLSSGQLSFLFDLDFYQRYILFFIIVGALLFSSMCLAGTSVFAIGLYFKGSSAMFPLFLLGRILFG